MIKNSDKIQLSLKKTIGSLQSVVTMVDNGVYCADIAQQINAAIGMLQGINRELLKNHLHCCGVEALKSDTETKTEFIDELVRTWDIVTRK